MLNRRQKPFDTIITDRNLPYYLGRIVGAAEVSAQLLIHQDNPDAKKIGENLERAVAWFVKEDEAWGLTDQT